MCDMDGPGYSHHVACTHSNILELFAVVWLSPNPRHPTCHPQRLPRAWLMPGYDEAVILPRMCDVCVIWTALATHIM